MKTDAFFFGVPHYRVGFTVFIVMAALASFKILAS